MYARVARTKGQPGILEKKIARNRDRDSESIEGLKALGWRVLTIWECEIGSISLTALKKFLNEGIV